MKIRDKNRRYASVLQPQHRLLLKAALLDKEIAVPAFETWHEKADWAGNFDAGTFQLLPQLYANLDRHGYDDPIMGRLRGLYRNAWYRNQELLAVLQKLVERLELNGVSTMLLGDGALMHGYCISPGVRNLRTLDILIPAEHTSAAAEIMTATGWHAASTLRYRQHACFTNGDDHTCTLYWHTPPRAASSHASSWQRARRAQLNGIDTLIPDAPEMLIHHVAHGLTEQGIPTLPGLAATATIAASQDMDWPAVSALANENFMGLSLYMALTAIKTELEIPIPDSVFSELGDANISFVEKLEHRATRRRPDSRDSFFGPLERLSLEFLRYTGNTRPLTMLTELPEFLRYRYGTDSLIRIFGTVAVNGVRRTGRVIARLFGRDRKHLLA